MLRRFSRPSETKEYSVIIERSQGVRYFVTEVEEKDRRTVNSYIDGLMSDSELIPSGVDKVCVNLRETDETLLCEVKPFSKN
jgi:hypothetical protein